MNNKRWLEDSGESFDELDDSSVVEGTARCEELLDQLLEEVQKLSSTFKTITEQLTQLGILKTTSLTDSLKGQMKLPELEIRSPQKSGDSNLLSPSISLQELLLEPPSLVRTEHYLE